MPRPADDAVRDVAHAMTHEQGGGRMKVPGGVTLLELLTVVMVIAILAAIGMTTMRRAVARSWWQEAQDLLLTINAGEQQYFDIEEGYKAPLLTTSGMAAWRTIAMDDPNFLDPGGGCGAPGSGPIPVSFNVAGTVLVAGKWTGFTASATNNLTGETMTIDQNGVLVTSGWPLP